MWKRGSIAWTPSGEQRGMFKTWVCLYYTTS